MNPRPHAVALLLAAVSVAPIALVAIAPRSASAQSAQSGVDPRRVTLERLMKPITVDLNDNRLEDVLKFIETAGDISIDPDWLEGSFSDGLERDAKITIKVVDVSLLTLLERVLAEAHTPGSASDNTWQLTPSGGVEVGPKSRLNKHTSLKIYDIQDLLFDIPNFTDAPQLDLNSVLNQRQGGGSGSIFQQTNQNNTQARDVEQRAHDLINIITSTVEPDQWQDNGGDAATIRYYNGSLLVRAPDYIMRQLGGYAFWPQSDTTAAASGGALKRDLAHAKPGAPSAAPAKAKSAPPTAPTPAPAKSPNAPH